MTSMQQTQPASSGSKRLSPMCLRASIFYRKFIVGDENWAVGPVRLLAKHHLAIAEELMYHNRLPEALKHIQKAQTACNKVEDAGALTLLKPLNNQVYLALSKYCQKAGDFQRAMPYLGIALGNSPNSADSWRNFMEEYERFCQRKNAPLDIKLAKEILVHEETALRLYLEGEANISYKPLIRIMEVVSRQIELEVEIKNINALLVHARSYLYEFVLDKWDCTCSPLSAILPAIHALNWINDYMKPASDGKAGASQRLSALDRKEHLAEELQFMCRLLHKLISNAGSKDISYVGTSYETLVAEIASHATKISGFGGSPTSIELSPAQSEISRVNAMIDAINKRLKIKSGVAIIVLEPNVHVLGPSG